MLRKIAFSILAFVLFIVLLETAARLFESVLTRPPDDAQKERGWQAEFFASYFEWHESDTDLLWRFKSNLANRLIETNSDGLLGGEIPAEKNPETVRILILGDSSPVGLGLVSREQAFDTILKYLLEMEYLGKRNFEVINAAVSGYTSEQIDRFLKLKGWGYQPDIVILYCGNNDASISGYHTDREIMKSQKLKEPRRFLSHLAFYRILKNLLQAKPNSDDSSTDQFKVRVPVEQFAGNLADIAGQCRDHNCPLFILKPPVPYLWPAGLQFKIFTHISIDDGKLIFPKQLAEILGKNIKYCLDKKRFEELYGTSDIFTKSVYSSAYDDSMTADEAVEYYSAQLLSDPKNHLLYNNLGVSFWMNGNYREADFSLKSARALFKSAFGDSRNLAIMAAGSPYLYNIGINLISVSGGGLKILSDHTQPAFAYLDSALQVDYFSLRIKDDYWHAIDQMSSDDNVIVIDLPTIFANSDGEKLFIDHCHPTFKGHYLIAEEILKAIKARCKL